MLWPLLKPRSFIWFTYSQLDIDISPYMCTVVEVVVVVLFCADSFYSSLVPSPPCSVLVLLAGGSSF